MAVPVFTGPYTPVTAQVVDIAAPVTDVTTGWSGADTFEVNTLPPGLVFDGTSLSGFNRVLMEYFIFIRGVNDDGPADWEPLQWSVTSGLTTARTLYGLNREYFLVHSSGTSSVLTVKKATPTGRQSTWNAGLLLINDVGDSTDRDGTSADYNSEFIGQQILLNGIADTFARATEPGWEIIIDTSS